MSELSKMLKRIINDNGNFVSKMQAEECLKELISLESRLNVSELVISEIGKVAKIGLRESRQSVDSILDNE